MQFVCKDIRGCLLSLILFSNDLITSQKIVTERDRIFIFKLSTITIECLNNWSVVAFGLISHHCVLTISVEYGLVRDGCPQLIGCVADVFALVLLQGVHGITECVECRRASVLRNLQLWVTAWVKLLSILCPSET